jgi:phosphoglycolate phosphatase-like HAD superfamily hydrolase
LSWLVLFDIDGTLLLDHDPLYVTANHAALEEVYGAFADVLDVPGDTAPAYTRRMMRAAGLGEEEIDAGLERWCERFSELYVEALMNADTNHWSPAPGAEAALAGIEHRALLTGNPEPVARARMQRLGLDGFFPPGQGAFGCEHEERVQLFGPARERAGDWPAGQTVAVGDTPIDVSSSHAAGCLCVGVTTGRYDANDLGEADVVIPGLTELSAALDTLARHHAPR